MNSTSSPRKPFCSFLLSTFIENTSMRGFRKCCSSRHSVLRLHWLFYIASMTVILGYGSYNLFAEFFTFNKSYQIEELLNDPTPFPSLTICSLNPFSPEVTALWRSGQVPSPARFSRELRHGMGQMVRLGRYADAASLFRSDKMATYFQFISESQATLLGHQLEELLPFCVMRHSKNANPSVAHEEKCSFKVTGARLHHPEYLVCYDLELEDAESSYVSSLSLIFSNAHLTEYLLHNFNSTRSEARNSAGKEHVFDIFNQGSGFRIVLHEPGTHPLADTDGFSVQMRTSTLIKYKAVKVQKLNYPAGECAERGRLPDILDDDSRYMYTFAACLSSQIGQLIRRQCNCTSAFHVRPPAVEPAAPYCGHYSMHSPLDFIRRLDCVRNLNLSELTASVTQTTCQKPCTFFHYESHLSSSNWTPQVWQIHWMMHISSALKQVMDNPLDQHFSEQLQRLINFTDLESVVGAPEVEALKVFESELAQKMALVTVTRMNYNTLVNQEALQITPSALMSRLGGLGSLTIGVTLTCAFELVELIYLTARRLRRMDRAADDGGGGGSNGPATEANQRAVTAATVELLLQQSGAMPAEHQGNHAPQGSYYDNCPNG